MNSNFESLMRLNYVQDFWLSLNKGLNNQSTYKLCEQYANIIKSFKDLTAFRIHLWTDTANSEVFLYALPKSKLMILWLNFEEEDENMIL